MQTEIAAQLPTIILSVVENMNSADTEENFPELFTEDCKLTYETIKKESRKDVAQLLQSKMKINNVKGKFELVKYSWVVISDEDFVISGLAKWANKSYLATICFQVKDQKLQISNLMLGRI